MEAQYNLRQLQREDITEVFGIIKNDKTFPHYEDHANFLRDIAAYFDAKKRANNSLEGLLTEPYVDDKIKEYARNLPCPIFSYHERFVIEEKDTDEKKIVGVTGLYQENKESNILWIGWTAIKPEKQRRGIGTKILKELEKEAKKKGAVSLNVYTDSSLNSAINFYRKNGFVEMKRDKDFYEPGLDKVTYSKELK